MRAGQSKGGTTNPPKGGNLATGRSSRKPVAPPSLPRIREGVPRTTAGAARRALAGLSEASGFGGLFHVRRELLGRREPNPRLGLHVGDETIEMHDARPTPDQVGM